MPHGLRAGDAGTIARLCGDDRRLLLRLGALLDARLAVSEDALRACVADPAGHALLMDRRLRDADEMAMLALAAEHGAGGLGLALAAAPDGWRVVAIEDEIGNPLLAAAAPPAAIAEPVAEPAPAAPALLAGLAPALRQPVEGLLAARADEQRAAALEQLRYAAPPLPVVAQLMPMLLADAADAVRERAIGLLAAAGAAPAVVDLIRALHRRDDAALARMPGAVAILPPIQQDLVVAATMATLARGQSSAALVGVCGALARTLAGHASLDRLIELLLPTGLSLVDLVRRVQDHAGERIARILAGHLATAAGAEQDAALVVLLAHPSAQAAGIDLDRLIGRGVELLIGAEAQPRDRMALAGALLRLAHLPGAPSPAVRIAAAGRGLARAFDTSVYWLLGELARSRLIAAADGERLAVDLVHLLRAAPGPHLVAILEQGLPGLLPAAADTRARLVEPMVEAVERFVGDRTADLVGSALAAIGAPALPPLWTVAEENADPAQRRFAIAELPELVAAAAPAEAGPAIDRLLAGLRRADQGAERGALAAAAARLLPLAADPARMAAVIAACRSLGRWAIEAWGLAAAAPGCPAGEREAIADRLLGDLTADVPDQPAAPAADAQGEVTWVLDEHLAQHTDDVPRLLAALERIARASDLDPALQRRIVDRLVKQWRLVSTWQVIWGPANVVELGRCLGALAAWSGLPAAQRLHAVQALQPRVLQLQIARALVPAYAAAGAGSILAELAGRAANALVERHAEGYYSEDEFGLLAEVLVGLAEAPQLGAETDRLRRRVVDALVAVRAHADGQQRTRIRALRAALPPALADKLAWA